MRIVYVSTHDSQVNDEVVSPCAIRATTKTTHFLPVSVPQQQKNIESGQQMNASRTAIANPIVGPEVPDQPRCELSKDQTMA